LTFDRPCDCSQSEGPDSVGCGEGFWVGWAQLVDQELTWEHDCEEHRGHFEATGGCGCLVGSVLQDLESCQPAQVKKDLVSRGEENEQLLHTHVGVWLGCPRLCLLHPGMLSLMGRADGTAGRETSFCQEESYSQRGLQESYGSGNVNKFLSFILSFFRLCKTYCRALGPFGGCLLCLAFTIISSHVARSYWSSPG
jgi:hypothetical protein